MKEPKKLLQIIIILSVGFILSLAGIITSLLDVHEKIECLNNDLGVKLQLGIVYLGCSIFILGLMFLAKYAFKSPNE